MALLDTTGDDALAAADLAETLTDTFTVQFPTNNHRKDGAGSPLPEWATRSSGIACKFSVLSSSAIEQAGKRVILTQYKIVTLYGLARIGDRITSSVLGTNTIQVTGIIDRPYSFANPPYYTILAEGTVPG